MLGPPVLLSYYVVCVIPCGLGVLSSLSPFLGCHSGSSELAWGFRGTPSDIRVALSCFRMRSSISPLPRLGVLGVSMLCLFLALFLGARLWCPLLSSRVLWRTFRPLPCSSVCGLDCTGPTNARQSQWETVISCAGGQGYLVRFGFASPAMRAVPFLPHGVTGRSSRRPLALIAVVTGVLPLGHRTVCFVSVELGTFVLPLRLFFVKNFAVILVEARESALALFLA